MLPHGKFTSQKFTARVSKKRTASRGSFARIPREINVKINPKKRVVLYLLKKKFVFSIINLKLEMSK